MSNIPMRQDIRQRALDLEAEVQSLQQELRAPEEVAGTVRPKLPVEDAKRLKRVIDDFRLFLWAYADSWGGSKGDTAAMLARIRLQAIADMMNLVRPDLAGKGIPDTHEGRALRLALQGFSQTVL